MSQNQSYKKPVDLFRNFTVNYEYVDIHTKRQTDHIIVLFLCVNNKTIFVQMSINTGF